VLVAGENNKKIWYRYVFDCGRLGGMGWKTKSSRKQLIESGMEEKRKTTMIGHDAADAISSKCHKHNNISFHNV